MAADIGDLIAQAESMMTDTCVLSRLGPAPDPPVFDPVTGTFEPNEPVGYYVGKCSVRVPGTVSTGKVRPSAGDNVSLLNAIVGIPVDAPVMAVGDTLLIVASTYNPALVGMEYSIIGLLPASWVTKQKAAISAVID